MRYIIITRDNKAFRTDWFSSVNNWSDNIHCVIDLLTNSIMYDGKNWMPIEIDTL